MKIKNLTCPKCQHSQVIHSAKSQAFVCTQCASLIDTDTVEILQENVSVAQKLSQLRLGLKGTIAGVEVELIGYILCQGSDDEDTWAWEEWLAVSDKGFHWLEYDPETEEFTFYTPYLPTKELSPDAFVAGKRIALSDEDAAILDEVAFGQTAGIEGELPWKAQVGETFYVADGHYRKKAYSIEWTEHEIEIFQGTRLSIQSVLEGLNMGPELAEFLLKEKRKLKWPILRLALWAVTVFCVVGAVYGMAGGDLILQQRIQACDDPSIASQSASLQSSSLLPPTDDASTCPDDPLIGPLQLKEKNRVYKIVVTSQTVSRTNWPFLTIELLNANQEIQSGFPGDFWQEDWVEGGERGTETNSQAEKLFRLSEPGEYYIAVELDKSEKSTSTTDTFMIEVYEHVIMLPYFLGLGAICVIIISLRDRWFKDA